MSLSAEEAYIAGRRLGPAEFGSDRYHDYHDVLSTRKYPFEWRLREWSKTGYAEG